MKDCVNHRILAPPALHPCGDGHKRLMVTEHRVACPLCYPDLASSDPADPERIALLDHPHDGFGVGTSLEDQTTVDVYFTVMELADEDLAASLADLTLSPRRRADAYRRRASPDAAERILLYLQGGPGFGCATPVSGLSLATAGSSWAAAVLLGDASKNAEGKAFERIVLMDQRGTGRSSPVSRRRLRKLFPDLFLTDDEASGAAPEATAGTQLRQAKVSKAATEAAEYLSRFRADSIVRDAEWVKEALVARNDEDARRPPRPWGAALGQSFGGFCLMTYLSSVARPPALCLFTGGIAPIDTSAREVYDRLWPRVRERNLRYYDRYPGDVAAVKRIVRHLLAREGDDAPVVLPSGGVLTARRFLQLGLGLGGSPGASFANLHSLVGAAFLDDGEEEEEGDRELSGAFLKRMDYEQSFDDAPLYFLLHESIYADGPSSGATNWAAHAAYERQVAADPAFDYRVTSLDDAPAAPPTLFFGEMVFPWMAEGDFAELSGTGMRTLAATLAAKDDWAPLYDSKNLRGALVGGAAGDRPQCRAASATYHDDMYVDFDCAMRAVARGGPLEGVQVWVTNEYQHSGLRDDGAVIVSKLLRMAKGTVHMPS